PNINSVRSNINTGRTNINSVRPNINTGRTNDNPVRPRVNTGSTNVNTIRFKQPVPTKTSNSISPKRPQESAVKTSTSYNWRNSRPNSNCDSGPNFIRTVNAKGPQGIPKPVKAWVTWRIFGSTNKSWCNEFEALMKSKFQMSSMGELTFFLGLQVKQNKAGIFISQDKYVAEMLKKFDLVNVKATITPMETKVALTKDEEAINVDVHLYRSMIGSLMCLTAFRPDIIIFKYLKGKPNLGLWYPRESPFDLEAFSDSDYGGSNLDRKSTTGGCQFLGQRLISWQCKKQTIVATSTTEAEYVAAANCCGQVLWVQNQLLDYGFNFMNTKIHIDNESTICIVKNPIYHSKTKHIEIRHHFIRDCYEKKLISVEKIHTDLNVADLLTKPFDGPRFNYLVVSIGIAWICRCKAGVIRYALTANPTIYDSLVKQFWQRALFAILELDGSLEINATSELPIRYKSLGGQIRDSLQLDDATGITMLPNVDLFEGQEHDAQAQSQPTPPPPPITTSPPPPIPSPTPPPIPTPTPPSIPTPTPPPIPTPTPPSITTPTPPPTSPPPETEPTTDEYIYEEHSPVHHHFSPSQEQAPSRFAYGDLLSHSFQVDFQELLALNWISRTNQANHGECNSEASQKVERKDEESKAQGRKSQDDPQDSSIQGLVTPPTTKVYASGSIDKGRRYREEKRPKVRKVVQARISRSMILLKKELILDGEVLMLLSEEVILLVKLYWTRVGKKAPMLSEETPKKSKEQILQEEASLAEAIRLGSLQKEEEAKQIHLDALLAQIH
ncbi:putative ribonuclease H-like domain-containing protein, partial [Tanacetum coccineum]